MLVGKENRKESWLHQWLHKKTAPGSRTWHIREGRELIIDPDPGTVSSNIGTCVQIHQEKTNAVHDTGNFIAERREDGETCVRNSQVERDYAGEI